jgi:hypothetical protein
MRRYRKKKKTYRKYVEEFREKFRYFVFGPYLEEGEVIVDIFHSHPIIILKDTLKVLLVGIAIPVFLAMVFPEIAFLCILWLAIGFIRLAYVTIDWYHDVILVTQSTLIDIHWEGIFTRLSTRLEFGMIEGIRTEIKGPLQLFLNYGKIIVQTTGGNTTFILEDVKMPRFVEKKILEYQNIYLSQQQFQDANQLKVLIATMLRNQALRTKTESTLKKK